MAALSSRQPATGQPHTSSLCTTTQPTHGKYATQATKLHANTNAAPPAAARLESKFQVAWMKAASTTRRRGTSVMRPPGHAGREKDLDVSSSGLLSLGCSRGSAAVSATLGPAAASKPPGTLVATRSIEERYPPKRKRGQPPGSSIFVMAGLVPAIHLFLAAKTPGRGWPGPSRGWPA